jgi:hypothetical protein
MRARCWRLPRRCGTRTLGSAVETGAGSAKVTAHDEMEEGTLALAELAQREAGGCGRWSLVTWLRGSILALTELRRQ